jgi:hypothetical protein
MEFGDLSPETEEDPLGFFVISGRDLMEALKRCERGEKADLVLMEIYANGTHEEVSGEPDEA